MAITWQPFEVCTSGDLTLVRLTLRQLTYDAVCGDIMESLAELWASGAAVRVVLDLASLESISSAGLAGLVMLRRRITALGGDLRLRGLRRRVREVFHVTKLDTLFCITGTRGVDL